MVTWLRYRSLPRTNRPAVDHIGEPPVKHSSYRSFIAAPIALALVLGACSSDSKSSAKTTASSGSTADSAATGDGNKAGYCAFVSGIETSLASVTSSDQALAVFKTFEPKMDQVIADAPAALKAGTQVQVDNARKAIAANDGTLTNTPEDQAAAAAGDAYCGITTGASGVAPSDTTIPATVNS